MSEYCPHIETCPFYQNLVANAGWERIDVIETGSPARETHYSCRALIAIGERQRNSDFGLKKRLGDSDNPIQNCSHITLLNLLYLTYKK